MNQDFPVGLLVKTSPSTEKGWGCDPWLGAKILYASLLKCQNVKQKQCCNTFNKDFKKNCDSLCYIMLHAWNFYNINQLYLKFLKSTEKQKRKEVRASTYWLIFLLCHRREQQIWMFSKGLCPFQTFNIPGIYPQCIL